MCKFCSCQHMPNDHVDFPPKHSIVGNTNGNSMMKSNIPTHTSDDKYSEASRIGWSSEPQDMAQLNFSSRRQGLVRRGEHHGSGLSPAAQAALLERAETLSSSDNVMVPTPTSSLQSNMFRLTFGADAAIRNDWPSHAGTNKDRVADVAPTASFPLQVTSSECSTSSQDKSASTGAVPIEATETEEPRSRRPYGLLNDLLTPMTLQAIPGYNSADALNQISAKYNNSLIFPSTFDRPNPLLTSHDNNASLLLRERGLLQRFKRTSP